MLTKWQKAVNDLTFWIYSFVAVYSVCVAFVGVSALFGTFTFICHIRIIDEITVY